MKSKGQIQSVCTGGLIAALYVVLTLFSAALGLSGSGIIQLRLSEALCVLPIFTPTAIPALAVGCFLSNLLTGCPWQDILFGTLATLGGGFFGYLLRKHPVLVPLPTVLCNAAVIPPILAYVYAAKGGILFFFLAVLVGEILCAYGLGMLLYAGLKPYRATLFLTCGEKKKATILLPGEVLFAMERLQRAGYEGYAVGGCVRDSLLGRVPGDWDMAVSSTPEETKAVFSDCRVIETGIRHGTVTVLIGERALEMTTFRTDGDYADNRHPTAVSFSRNLADDLARRDFTVNAMAYRPDVGVVDRFGGIKDLKKKTLRTVGDADRRFAEDGLRILRAIRFSSVLGFSIEEKTANSIHASGALLANISAERIREEFCKLLLGEGAASVLREYIDTVGVFLPELSACKGFSQNTPYHCYDVLEHTLAALDASERDLITRLAILFHDIGKPETYSEDEAGGHFYDHGKVGAGMAEAILRRLRFDNDTLSRVRELVAHHDAPIPATEKSVKRLMRIFSDEDIDRLMEIKRCDRLAHAKGYREPVESLTAVPELVRKIRAENDCFRLSDLAVNGDDLIAAGIPKGKEIGQILSRLLDAVIDGELPNEKEILMQHIRF